MAKKTSDAMIFKKIYCHMLTLKFPWVTKTEFLLTTSIQYQADKWQELRKYQLGDLKLIQCQILQTNITKTVW